MDNRHLGYVVGLKKKKKKREERQATLISMNLHTHK
jgi:hypothetical protein